VLDPLEELVRAEVVTLFRLRFAVALADLSERDRRIVALSDLEERPLELLAKELGLTRESACRARSHARRRLRERLLADPVLLSAMAA